MKKVKMFGPSISDPSQMVNRDVPECDVQAYRNAGYEEGSLPDEPKAEKGEKVAEEPKPKTKAKK